MSLYNPSPEILEPSKADIVKLLKVTEMTRYHNSGGSYDMIAMLGSPRIWGYNRLRRPASTISDTYPEDFGVHAELDLYRKMGMNPSNPSSYSGTVYIAGKLNSSGSFMTNTMPCTYCVAILRECGITNVVFYFDGMPAKANLRTLNGF